VKFKLNRLEREAERMVGLAGPATAVRLSTPARQAVPTPAKPTLAPADAERLRALHRTNPHDERIKAAAQKYGVKL
jgi:hypothetical protein